MIIRTTIIYIFMISIFAPICAHDTSKGSLSEKDIENIANRVVEKLKEKSTDPEQIEKNIENYITMRSHPKVQEFERENTIKNLSSPQVIEARTKQINQETKAFFKSHPMLAYAPLIAVAAVSGSISFCIGIAIGKSR